jgi:hypothetical protein
MNLAEALSYLESLELPHGDYAVFGSGPLLIRGIIDNASDLDVVARGAAWEQAAAAGQLVHLSDHNVTVASFFDGAITIGTRWAIGDFTVDELIDTAELIKGIPFVRLEHVRSYKNLAGRRKDIDHLEKLDRWLKADSRRVGGH